jgi:hypothetical protein
MILNTWKRGGLGMSFNSISRRAVLVSLGSTPLTVPTISSRSVVKGGPTVIRFYVAGTRFQRSVSRLRSGVAVRVTQYLFNGSFGYAVEVADGRQIGFVPAKLVPLLETAKIRAGWLSSVDYETVPWQIFRVILELS